MFITFEGIEGSGKSTQAKLIREYMEQRGRKVSLTHEPGWGTVGKLIRHLILEEKDLNINPFTELYLFCADRVQHVQDFIKPRLDSGEDVICDRYFDSTIVYQGYGRNLDLNTVRKLAEASTLGIKPDITFLLDLSVKEGLKRLNSRKNKTNRLDDESVDFHELIQQGYISEASLNTDRIRTVNAARDIRDVQNQIKDLIASKF